MYRAILVALVGLLVIAGSAQGDTITLTDTFNTSHDYITGGVTGTIWDGLQVNGGSASTQNTTLSDANANTTNAGVLTLRSQNGNWEGADDDGVFLYRNVTGDFTADVTIAGYTFAYYNDMGLMVRDPDTTGGEDYVSNRYFNGWFNSIRSTDDGVSTNTNSSGIRSRLRITRVGSAFSFYRWDPGTSAWLNMSGSPLVRSDMPDTLQIGLWQATFSSNYGEGRFDEFSLAYTSTVPEPASLLLLGVGLVGLGAARRRRHDLRA